MAWVDCILTRWVSDEPQPGLVEARFTDADGTEWYFEEKEPIFFSSDMVTPASEYPVPGATRCVIVEENEGQGRTVIDTGYPDGVAAVDGMTTRFSMPSGTVKQ